MSEKEGFNSLRGDRDFSKLRQLHYFSKLNPISVEQKINLLRLDRNAFLETFLEDAKLDSGKLLLQKIFWNEPTRENLLILTFYFFPYFFLSYSFISFSFSPSFRKSFLHSSLLKNRMDKMMCEIFRLWGAIPLKKVRLVSFNIKLNILWDL